MESLAAAWGLDVLVLGILGAYVVAELLLLWLALKRRMRLRTFYAWSVALSSLLVLLVALAARLPWYKTALLMLLTAAMDAALALNLKHRAGVDGPYRWWLALVENSLGSSARRIQ